MQTYIQVRLFPAEGYLRVYADGRVERVANDEVPEGAVSMWIYLHNDIDALYPQFYEEFKRILEPYLQDRRRADKVRMLMDGIWFLEDAKVVGIPTLVKGKLKSKEWDRNNRPINAFEMPNGEIIWGAGDKVEITCQCLTFAGRVLYK